MTPRVFQYVQSFERKRGPDLVVTSSLAKQVMIELDSEKEEDVARSWGVIFFFLCGKRWGFWNRKGVEKLFMIFLVTGGPQ